MQQFKEINWDSKDVLLLYWVTLLTCLIGEYSQAGSLRLTGVNSSIQFGKLNQ